MRAEGETSERGVGTESLLQIGGVGEGIGGALHAQQRFHHPDA